MENIYKVVGFITIWGGAGVLIGTFAGTFAGALEQALKERKKS